MESIPESGKAAILPAHGAALEIVSRKLRELKEKEVLVKIVACGLCHTDVHVQEGAWSVPGPTPLVLGHEGVGRVVKRGAGVTSVAEGTMVVIPWLWSACGACGACQSGWESTCADIRCTGYTVDGCFGEYAVAHSDFVMEVPEGLEAEAAAPIACAGLTVYKALKEAELEPKQWVLFVGAGGGLGHLGVQYARHMGFRVVSLVSDAKKLAFVKSLGSELAFDSSAETDIVAKIVKATGGVSATIILAPDTDAVNFAASVSTPRAVILPISLPEGNFLISPVLLNVKALRIKGSVVGTRQDLREALAIAATGAVKPVIALRPFEQINEAIAELKSRTVVGRLVMTMAA